MPKQMYIIPFRAGFFMIRNRRIKARMIFSVSAGTGYVYKQFVFDMAYQYRFGRDVRTTTVGNEDSSQNVDQHTVYASLIYHF